MGEIDHLHDHRIIQEEDVADDDQDQEVIPDQDRVQERHVDVQEAVVELQLAVVVPHRHLNEEVDHMKEFLQGGRSLDQDHRHTLVGIRKDNR